MLKACTVCATPGCTRHNQARQGTSSTGSYNPNRDMAAHARFARAVKRRDHNRCVICGSTLDIRATHIVPLHKGGSDDPSNGRTLCRTHDLMTDPYAR